jgi:hypothetical protein
MTQEAHEPEPGLDDAVTGDDTAGEATPGEYTAADQQGGVSEDTGVVYEQDGTPEETPHDQELLGDEDETL